MLGGIHYNPLIDDCTFYTSSKKIMIDELISGEDETGLHHMKDDAESSEELILGENNFLSHLSHEFLEISLLMN